MRPLIFQPLKTLTPEKEVNRKIWRTATENR
jgi:hypothetical protein